MVAIRNFDEFHRTVNAHFPGKAMQARDDRPPTIHLYHAPNSICSQKVRAVLLFTGQAFVSHELDLSKGETYDPDYVRLRLLGCRAAGLPLANDHPGTTSATATGCDACVVPTVVATDSNEVLVDSKNICIALDRRNPAAPSALMPENLRDSIETEISIVDNLPNYQLGVSAGRPGAAAPGNSLAVSKVRRCDALISDNANDEALCTAYAAKRAKEQIAADRLFDAAAIDRARHSIDEALRELDRRLQKSDGPCLFGSSPTMADLFWSVELIRIDDLGMSALWSNGKLPALDAYYQRMSQLPAVLDAVTRWPGARLKVNATSRS